MSLTIFQIGSGVKLKQLISKTIVIGCFCRKHSLICTRSTLNKSETFRMPWWINQYLVLPLLISVSNTLLICLTCLVDKPEKHLRNNSFDRNDSKTRLCQGLFETSPICSWNRDLLESEMNLSHFPIHILIIISNDDVWVSLI